MEEEAGAQNVTPNNGVEEQLDGLRKLNQALIKRVHDMTEEQTILANRLAETEQTVTNLEIKLGDVEFAPFEKILSDTEVDYLRSQIRSLWTEKIASQLKEDQVERLVRVRDKLQDELHALYYEKGELLAAVLEAKRRKQRWEGIVEGREVQNVPIPVRAIPVRKETLKIAGTPVHPCAACRYQRKRCTPNCPLAPFFPPGNDKQFLSVHKIFEPKYIIRVLSTLDTMEKKQTALQSICWEAECREKDPVQGSWGCYRKLSQEKLMLQRRIQHLTRNPNNNLQLQITSICSSAPETSRAAAATASYQIRQPPEDPDYVMGQMPRLSSLYQRNNYLQLQNTSICSSAPETSGTAAPASYQIHQPPIYYNENPNYVSYQANFGMGQMPYPSSLLQGTCSSAPETSRAAAAAASYQIRQTPEDPDYVMGQMLRPSSLYQRNNYLQLQNTSICSSAAASHQIRQPPIYYNENPNNVSYQANFGMGQMPYPSSLLQIRQRPEDPDYVMGEMPRPSSLLQGGGGFNHPTGGEDVNRNCTMEEKGNVDRKS